MNRRMFGRAGLLFAAFGLGGTAEAGNEAAPQSRRSHRIALQVSVSDPALMNLAVTNVANIAAHYAGTGEAVMIDLTAFGPGYAMVQADASPVKARIAALAQCYPSLTISAYQNARRAIAASEGRAADILQIPEARDVPAGVVHLPQLQEQGWSYLWP